MSEGIRRSPKERVFRLVACPAGQRLYRTLKFEMLGHFMMRIREDKGEGIMIHYPEGSECDACDSLVADDTILVLRTFHSDQT